MALFNKYPTGNNVTFSLILYEYAGKKQYVRTMIEFHYKWCELVLHDEWFGLSLRKTGVTKCPSPAGQTSISNMSFTGHVPFDVPFEKGKFQGIWKIKSTGEIMISIDVFVVFVK
ncbi:hypothetical protein B5X24_HaOG204576 [Helicoverpa armigera]|nr:hypothetical protein B5X24_HaOG204576 [Helicoverpa armigera]